MSRHNHQSRSTGPSLASYGKGLSFHGKRKLFFCIPVVFFIAGGVLSFMYTISSHVTTLTAFAFTTQVLDIDFKDKLRMVANRDYGFDLNLDIALWKCSSPPERISHPIFTSCDDLVLTDGDAVMRRFSLLEGSNITVNFNPVFSYFFIAPESESLTKFQKQESFANFHICSLSQCQSPFSFTVPSDLTDLSFVFFNAVQDSQQASSICFDFDFVVHDLSKCERYCGLQDSCEINHFDYQSFTFVVQGSDDTRIDRNHLVNFAPFTDGWTLNHWGLLLIGICFVIIFVMSLLNSVLNGFHLIKDLVTCVRDKTLTTRSIGNVV
ncbi:hypothetical protein P9112_003678 [Eukaryota sp. TZLM1-RC]